VNLDHLFSNWDQIHSDTLAVLEMFYESELNTTAYEGGWTVAEIALHIANAEDGWFRLIVEKKYNEWPKPFTQEDFPTKEAINTLLKTTHNKTMGYLRKLTLKDLNTIFESDWGKYSLGFIIWHVIEHEIHHRGELSLILGILGREGLGV